MFSGEREIAVMLMIIVYQSIVSINSIKDELCAREMKQALDIRSVIIFELSSAITFETKHVSCIEVSLAEVISIYVNIYTGTIGKCRSGSAGTGSCNVI